MKRTLLFTSFALLSAIVSGAEPTAHDPQFTNKSFWPKVSNEYFLKQSWPAGRVYVWARPGESAGEKAASLNAYDASNWRENGSPAKELILGETSDFVLPDSGKEYTVNWKKPGQEHARISYRHLTVGKNARWRTSGADIFGNVWIKKGGSVSNHGAATGVGSSHSFYRNDAGDPRVSKSPGSHVSQYVTLNKPNGSQEFIGAFSMTDEFKVMNGIMIIGVDSRMEPGRNATPLVAKNGTLALMDGAYFGKWINQLDMLDMDMQGKFYGGLPDRPLSRSCTWGLGFKNWNGTHFPVQTDSEDDKEWNSRRVTVWFKPGSEIKSYSANPEAKLQITHHLIPTTWAVWDAENPKTSAGSKNPAIKAAYDSIPKLIDMYVDNGVIVENIVFDYLHAGGILIPDAAAKDSFKSVAFGPHCAASGDALYQIVTKLGRSGEY